MTSIKNSIGKSAVGLVLAAGSTASAGSFTAFGPSGNWTDHSIWSGPANEYPDSIADTAAIGGNASVTADINITVGALSVLGSSHLYSAGHSIFVAGDLFVSADMSVTDTPALRDLDADAISISGGRVGMYGGVMQADESISVTGQGAILGVGVVEMNSTVGDIEIQEGALWAWGSPSASTDVLLVRNTGSSTARLDWSNPNGALIAWQGAALDVQIPPLGPLGGELNVATGSEIRIDSPFTTLPGSEIRMGGGDLPQPAKITAPAIDHLGVVNVNGAANFAVDWMVVRDAVEIAAGERLTMSGALTQLDSATVTADGPGAEFDFTSFDAQTFRVSGAGLTDIDMSGGVVDLDGSSGLLLRVDGGSHLRVRADRIDDASNEVLTGEMQISGTLELLKSDGGFGFWENAGTISLLGGEYAGRFIENTGELRGRGDVDAVVWNGGTIEAQGGTLRFLSQFVGLSNDGDGRRYDAEVRAQVGDISWTTPNANNGNTSAFFGSMYIGDGTGNREVFEINHALRVGDSNDPVGSIEMDGGRLRAGSLLMNGSLNVLGPSRVDMSGGPSANLRFMSTSQTSVASELEVYGDIVTEPGAAFSGSGRIIQASTAGQAYLFNTSDLGGLTLEINGRLETAEGFNFPESTVSIGSLELQPTSKTGVDVYGLQEGDAADLYAVAGTAELGGVLVVRTPSFVPSAGGTFTVLQAGAIVGAFDSVDASEVDPSLKVQVTQTATEVQVTLLCAADFNNDGSLDIDDVLGFLAAFSAEQTTADFDRDGDLDIDDVLLFLSLFSTGCP